MDFLKNKRKKEGKTLRCLASEVGIHFAALSDIEFDRIPLGPERANKIAEALDIPVDVMTVYRGHLPEYAKNTYRTKPDKLEKELRKLVKKLEKDNPTISPLLVFIILVVLSACCRGAF
jgi:transcriptional regulator with XRE-family HTH domain